MKWKYSAPKGAFGHEVIGPDGLICQMSHHPDERKTAEANAHLIATTPELLKATKQALEIFEGEWPEDDEIMGPVMTAYRALINRAEGGK